MKFIEKIYLAIKSAFLSLNLKMPMHPLVFRLVALLFAVSSLSSTQNTEIQSEVLSSLNEDLQSRRVGGAYIIDQNKNLVIQGGSTPRSEIDRLAKEMGIDVSLGSGGIDPYKYYTPEEYALTPYFVWYINRLAHQDLNKYLDGKAYGLDIWRGALRCGGANVFKDAHEGLKKYHENKSNISNTLSRIFAYLSVFKQKEYWAVFAGVLVGLFAVPPFLFYLAKNLVNWVFVSRPKILKNEDTDIYGSFFWRWFSFFKKKQEMPKVIAGKGLKSKLNDIVFINNKITKNNAGWFLKNSQKMMYTHILAYGEAGVGKTLFAKKLATQSGMHYMYMSCSNLAQLPEEEAVKELRKMFSYARSFKKCLFIVDEADVVFGGSTAKMKFLETSFQTEFSGAVDADVQLFFITNFPEKISRPIINRCGRLIHFKKPAYLTQLKLLQYYIDRFAKKRGASSVSVSSSKIKQSMLAGFVGRDFQKIANELYNHHKHVSGGLLMQYILLYRKEQEDKELFLKQKKTTHFAPKTPQIKKKSFFI